MFVSRGFMLRLLLLLLAAATAGAQHEEEEYVSMPATIGQRVPDRIVFNSRELSQCINDSTARRCILQASEPLVLDHDSWPQSFPQGVAEIKPSTLKASLTIASRPLSDSAAVSTQQQTLDFSKVPNAFLVQPGGRLTFSGLQLINLAAIWDYLYSTSQPYRSIARGRATWPSIGLAPNATLTIVNSSLLYTNPSPGDDCVSYTEKRLFAFQQLWQNRVQSYNATANKVAGPINIPVPIVDANSNTSVGQATVVYENLTLVCMPATADTDSQRGMSPGALAAAIAAPIAALLAVVALLACCYIRRRSRFKHQHSGLGPLIFDKQTQQGSSSNMLLKDLEDGKMLADTDLFTDKPSTAPSSLAAPHRLGHPVFGTAPAGTKLASVPNEPADASGGAVAVRPADAQQALAGVPSAQQPCVDATQQRSDVRPSWGEGAAGRSDLQQHNSQTALASTHVVEAGSQHGPSMEAGAASIRSTSRGHVHHSSSFRRDSSIPPSGSVRKTDADACSGAFCSGGASTDTGSVACGLRQRSPPTLGAAAPSHSRRGSAVLAARSSAGAPFSSGGAHSSGAGGRSRVSSAAHSSAEPWGGSGATAGSGGQLPGTSTQGTIVPCDLSILSTAARSKRYGMGSKRSNRINDCLDSLQALLKARSDVAVLRDLKIGPLLGRGSYGRVYKGRWKATTVAVKIIEHRTGGNSSGKGKSAGQEELLATSASHPNVVKVYHVSSMSAAQRSTLAVTWQEDSAGSGRGSLMQDATGQQHGSSDSNGSSGSSGSSEDVPPDLLETWVIMEYCEHGSLERAMKLGKFKRPPDKASQLVGIYKALLDTASGLDYLHSIGVVHGDLKTANVLLRGSSHDARGVTCKLTDFGLSRVLDRDASHHSTGTYGTVAYMPKELLLAGRMTHATDIYSFGLMMWELFTGETVTDEGLSIGQMFYMIAYQDWRPDIPADCPPDFVDLMKACWHDDPEQRPSASQLLKTMQKLYAAAKQQYVAAKATNNQADKVQQAAKHQADRVQQAAAASSSAAGGSRSRTAATHASSSQAAAAQSAGAVGGSANDGAAGGHSSAQGVEEQPYTAVQHVWQQQEQQLKQVLQHSVRNLQRKSRRRSSLAGSGGTDSSAVVDNGLQQGAAGDDAASAVSGSGLPVTMLAPAAASGGVRSPFAQ